MTLIDQHNRNHEYLRISLTEKCNLRCTYCMPAEGIPLLPRKELMQADEVFEIAKAFVDMGVRKIRLTGGEPLVRKDFTPILRQLATLPVELAISTNAILIDQYFDVFKEVGLKKINISLDSLKEDRFKQIARRDHFQKVMTNLDLAIKHGSEVKVNVVLMRGFNDDEIVDFIEFTHHRKIAVRFIEFMPFDGNDWDQSKLVSLKEILEATAAHYGNRIIRIEDQKNDTTKNYQVENYQGSWGVISTVTGPFCASCNRMRLTANGKMKNCLFDNNEADLLGTLRQGRLIQPLVRACLGKKEAVRAGMDTPEKIADKKLNQDNRSMIAIGG